MSSMYETIMELPLFKGISEEQVSMFLEKTRVGFSNYEENDIIVNSDERVNGLDFILSGEIVKIHKLKKIPIRIEETIGKGNVMGALNLYGLHTTYGYDVKAASKVSMMHISKEHYMNLLQANGIYIINYLNLLSAAAQRPVENMLLYQDFTPGRRIYDLLLTICSPFATKISIFSDMKELAKFCGVTEEIMKNWTKLKEEEGFLNSIENNLFITKENLHKLI